MKSTAVPLIHGGITALITSWVLCTTPPPAAAQSSQVAGFTMTSDLVPGPVEVGVLLPPDYPEAREPYRLLLLLHGANDDASFLGAMRPIIEEAWERRDLPPLVVATPSARRSWYMDYRDGSQRWETLIFSELLPRLRREFRVRSDPEGTLIAGYSMGGMGAFRMAFKHPDQFGVVVGLAAAIEPVFSFDDVEPRDSFDRGGGIYQEIFGDPVDREYWQANHPLYLARENVQAIKESGLHIYIEVGDLDSFGLFRGNEVLHRLLYDAGVKHEYRLVQGAQHVGPSVPARMANSLRFVGRAICMGRWYCR